jgi:transforming growth factor-beta-induced protein
LGVTANNCCSDLPADNTKPTASVINSCSRDGLSRSSFSRFIIGSKTCLFDKCQSKDSEKVTVNWCVGETLTAKIALFKKPNSLEFYCKILNLAAVRLRKTNREHAGATTQTIFEKVENMSLKTTLLRSAVLPALLVLSGQALNAQQCPHAKAMAAKQCPSQQLMTVSTVAPASQEKDIVDTAVGAGKFNTLVAAVKAAGLVETLKGKGPFTVFAPTDEAFAKLPEGTVESLLKPENKDKLVAILTYHVVGGNVMAADVVKLDKATTVQGQDVAISAEGGKVKVNDANVVATDIKCSNGVIHVIDAVILPSETPDIVDTAVKAGKFTTLVAAVKAAGLVDTLKGKGPFTVFAPTDEAFGKLPTEAVQDLLKPENKEKLAGILTYHVVPGKVMAADVVKLTSATTVNGQKATVKVEDGKVMIDNAQVIKTDIECGNGVIHIIDSVIMPK